MSRPGSPRRADGHGATGFFLNPAPDALAWSGVSTFKIGFETTGAVVTKTAPHVAQ